MDLGMRVRLRPERVSGCHWFVEDGRRPMILVAGMRRDRAGNLAESADTRRRIGPGEIRRRQRDRHGNEGNAEREKDTRDTGHGDLPAMTLYRQSNGQLVSAIPPTLAIARPS